MNAKITIGTLQNYDDVRRTNYDWNAVADRLYDILDVLPETPIGRTEYIVDWRMNGEVPEKDSIIRVKFKNKDIDDILPDSPEDFYDWWDVPARYLFMTDDEIVADWNREQEEKEAYEKKRQQQLEAAQEQRQYETYLCLKEVYEGTEAVNGLPEKSPNL